MSMIRKCIWPKLNFVKKLAYCWRQTSGTPPCSFPCDTQHQQNHKHRSCQSHQLQKAVLSGVRSVLQTPGGGNTDCSVKRYGRSDIKQGCYNFQTVSELQHQLGSRNIYLGMTLYLPLSTARGSPIQAAACVTHLSSVSSVPTGHNEMCWQLLLVLVRDVPHQSGSGADLGVLTYLSTVTKGHELE